MPVTTQGTGDDDPTLPGYRIQAEVAYFDGLKRGFESPIVLILDPLYEPCQSLIASVLGTATAERLRLTARSHKTATMLVGAWPQAIVLKHLEFPGASQIVDAIHTTGDFAIFILDGNGGRWFNCPIPKR